MIAVAVASVLLAGCSALGDGPEPLVTVKIGLDSPLSGDLSEAGLGIRNSVELAVAVANERHLVPGVRFALDARDDAADPRLAKANAAAFAADSALIGVVGPYNSSVALEMTPVLAQAGVAQVSPSNTLPALTWGTDYQSRGKTRPYSTYFRTVTTDAVQGPYLADYLRRNMQVANVAVVSDTKAYGAALAEEFATEFEYAGGKVVFRRAVEPGTTDFSAIVEQIRSSKAQLVYYGGESPEAGPLAAQLAAAGARIPVAGGDAMHNNEYLHLAGQSAAEGTLATSAGIAIDNLASAYAYVDAYNAASYTQPHGPFGPYAYDSAWALMTAVGAVVANHGGALPDRDLREAVTAALQNVSFFGVTGDVSFDEYGNSRNQVVSLYRVTNGSWETLVPVGRWGGH
jgi:branched-chain amino acid transport system substrate-binding protein